MKRAMLNEAEMPSAREIICSHGPNPVASCSALRGMTDDRLDALDALRLLAVVGIVWFHMHALGSQIAYSALPALLVLSIALTTRRSSRGTLASRVYRRGQRLLTPWLFWSAIYGAVAIASAWRHHRLLSNEFDLTMLVTGTSLHLWYLPFVFLATLVTSLAYRVLIPLSPRVVATIGAVTGGLVLFATAYGPQVPIPCGQWKFGAAAIPLGLAIGMIELSGDSAAQRASSLTIAGVVVLCALTLVALGHGASAVPYGIGVPMVCAAISCKPRVPKAILPFFPLAIGIYLLHPLVASQVVFRISSRYHTATEINAVLVVILTAVLTLILRKSPFLRRFL